MMMSSQGDDESADEDLDIQVDATARELSDGRLVIYNPDPECYLDEHITSTVYVDLPKP